MTKIVKSMFCLLNTGNKFSNRMCRWVSRSLNMHRMGELNKKKGGGGRVKSKGEIASLIKCWILYIHFRIKLVSSQAVCFFVCLFVLVS